MPILGTIAFPRMRSMMTIIASVGIWSGKLIMANPFCEVLPIPSFVVIFE